MSLCFDGYVCFVCSFSVLLSLISSSFHLSVLSFLLSFLLSFFLYPFFVSFIHWLVHSFSRFVRPSVRPSILSFFLSDRSEGTEERVSNILTDFPSCFCFVCCFFESLITDQNKKYINSFFGRNIRILTISSTIFCREGGGMGRKVGREVDGCVHICVS